MIFTAPSFSGSFSSQRSIMMQPLVFARPAMIKRPGLGSDTLAGAARRSNFRRDISTRAIEEPKPSAPQQVDTLVYQQRAYFGIELLKSASRIRAYGDRLRREAPSIRAVIADARHIDFARASLSESSKQLLDQNPLESMESQKLAQQKLAQALIANIRTAEKEIGNVLDLRSRNSPSSNIARGQAIITSLRLLADKVQIMERFDLE